jgi:hypothetical protein
VWSQQEREARCYLLWWGDAGSWVLDVGGEGRLRQRLSEQQQAVYHSVYEQHSSVPISVYTRPIAQFLVGNGRFKWAYVMRKRQERRRDAAGGGALDSRAPPAPVQPVEGL